MTYLEPPFLFWMLSAIQIVGLLSAWLARLSEGSNLQACCHWLFLGCLALLGLTTMFSIALATKYWLVSGMTLSVMILAAIWDFRPHVGATTVVNPIAAPEW